MYQKDCFRFYYSIMSFNKIGIVMLSYIGVFTNATEKESLCSTPNMKNHPLKGECFVRKLIFLMGTMLILTLVACNQSTAPVNQEKNHKKDTESVASELTLDEVMEKAIEASDSLKSFTVEMQMDQKLSGVEDETIHFLSNIDMDFVQDPMALHQKMSIELVGEDDSLDTEIYFTKDGVFYYDVTTDEWIQFQEDMFDELVKLADHQTNPAHEINSLQQYADELVFDQDKDNYVMTLEASGEKFTQFIRDKVSETLPDVMDLDTNIFENIEINQLSYKILIDKETFYPDTLHLVMELVFSEGNDTVKVNQEINGKYKNFNNKSTIDVPKEILDEAVDIGV